MRQKSETPKTTPEQVVKDIRRATRKHHSAEQKIRIVLAGLRGDGWNLGFVVETEHQVEAHLEEHLRTLPEADQRSRAILQEMKEDESRHADHAEAAGARLLPQPIPSLMAAASTLIKAVAYRF